MKLIYHQRLFFSMFYRSRRIEIITNTASKNGYTRNGMIDILPMPAIPDATKSCAPYGIIPCIIHEQVSRSDAVFFEHQPGYKDADDFKDVYP